MKSYRIEFTRRRTTYEKANNMNGFIDDEHRFDETEFDAESPEEAVGLFVDFTDEQGYEDVDMTDIYEVPYDGEEE